MRGYESSARIRRLGRLPRAIYESEQPDVISSARTRRLGRLPPLPVPQYCPAGPKRSSAVQKAPPRAGNCEGALSLPLALRSSRTQGPLSILETFPVFHRDVEKPVQFQINEYDLVQWAYPFG